MGMVLSFNKYYVNVDNRNIDNTDKFKDMPQDIEICNLGSSHGLYSFNYTDIEKTSFNFGLLAQMPSYDYRLLEYYQDRLSDECIVFVPVSYFVLIGKSEEEDHEFEFRNKRYYKILPPEYVKRYSIKDDIFVSMLPSLANESDFWDIVLKRAKSTDELWYMNASGMDVGFSAEEAYTRHFQINRLDENGKYIVNQEEVDALYDIIDLCEENGWKPVLVTTPLLNEYRELAWKLSFDYIKDFYGIVNKLCTEKGVDYYDYSYDERFNDRYDLFMDVDHLNVEGAREFTDILYDEVTEEK